MTIFAKSPTVGSYVFTDTSVSTVNYAGTQSEWNNSGWKNVVGDSVTVNYNYGTLSIITQPTNKTIYLGDSVTLSLKATGDGLTYQWYFKKSGQSSFSAWNGHTSASETCVPNATWNGILLYCRVKDKYGNQVNSNKITVTVNKQLAITHQPEDRIITLGDSLTVSVRAVGNGLTYQWYFKKEGQSSFSKWNGRTHASETCTPNKSWNGIQLYCLVKDSEGHSVKSRVAKVRVTPPITIISQTQEVTVRAGKSATFSVSATGRGLTYQWLYKKAGQTTWNQWKGKTTASITVVSNATWNGMLVQCIITDQNGYTLNSNNIKVTIPVSEKRQGFMMDSGGRHTQKKDDAPR